MKSVKICILLILILIIKTHCEDTDFNLESLKAPSMPASSIIGIQVSEVNRPKSLKTLEAAVFSNYIDSEQNLSLPENYALEINPYMIRGMVNFNYKSYVENNIFNNIWHNFSISVSSTNKFQIRDSTQGNALGFGLRTLILNGLPRDSITKIFDRVFENDSLYDIIQVRMPVAINKLIDNGYGFINYAGQSAR